MKTALEWQFGGWLGGLSPGLAWSLLGLIAVAGSLLVLWLYRRTLRQLSPAQRWTLAAFRIALLLVLLLCLANPSRVISTEPSRPDRASLAVVVDRSDSMNTADQRGESRLKNASRIWARHLSEAQEKFSKTAWFRFSSDLQEIDSLEKAVGDSPPGAETHLYQALTRALESNPGAVVCLTDGLDTTGTDAEKLVAEAQRRAVPLYFVAGTNRLRVSETMGINDIRLPAKVLRQTKFNAQSVFQITTSQEHEVPGELWSGATLLASQKFKVHPGLNTFPWSVAVTAAEPGPLPLEFRIGSGTNQHMAGGTTQVVSATKVDILYYQGALQWGYRFLLSALRDDDSFRVTSIINPALGLKMSASTSSDLATLSDLPSTAAGFKKYQIVVLAHVFADQLEPAQQQALVDYAKGGGGVLFIAPDASATASYAGTAVEQMLPVIFEPAKVESPEEAASRRFDEQMLRAGGRNVGTNDGEFHRDPSSKLLPYALPPGGAKSRVGELFSGKDPAGVPQFSDYAPVRHVKAGAEVLAVHPKDFERDGRTHRVLMARQQFGDGYTVALTTDLLWRWKMSLPHESRAVEKFWQQLFLSLAPATGQGLRLVKDAAPAMLKRPVFFRLEGASATALPKVIALGPDGAAQPLPLRPGGSKGGWQVELNPAQEGRWEVRATDAAGGQARVSVVVAQQPQTKENANLPADVEGLRRLAESTGGKLIENDPVFQIQSAGVAVEEKHSSPLWNQQWLLGLLLGIYGTELLTRRWMKLL